MMQYFLEFGLKYDQPYYTTVSIQALSLRLRNGKLNNNNININIQKFGEKKAEKLTNSCSTAGAKPAKC